jgi:hypothetical protein
LTPPPPRRYKGNTRNQWQGTGDSIESGVREPAFGDDAGFVCFTDVPSRAREVNV